MAVGFYMDVHVKNEITEQLRLRGIDVLTTIEDEHRKAEDEVVLERARQLGRVVFTQDIRFRVLAEDWQRQGRDFAGLLFGHQMGAGIGKYVEDLELIGKASNPEEWRNIVDFLPY